MASEKFDFFPWEFEMLSNRWGRAARRANAIGALAAGACTLYFATSLFSRLAEASESSSHAPVQEVNVTVLPSDYGQNSALITGLTPLSATGRERVAAEIGCNSKGTVTYTLLGGYEAPNGTTSEVNSTLASLPNPCTDFTISRSETPQILTIAEATGLLEYRKR